MLAFLLVGQIKLAHGAYGQIETPPLGRPSLTGNELSMIDIRLDSILQCDLLVG